METSLQPTVPQQHSHQKRNKTEVLNRIYTEGENRPNESALWQGHVSTELLTSRGNTTNPVTGRNWVSTAQSPHSDMIRMQFLKSPGHISLRVSQRPFFSRAAGLQQADERWLTDGPLTAL